MSRAKLDCNPEIANYATGFLKEKGNFWMRPQVFVATFVYCLPDLKGQNGFVQPVAVGDLSSPEKRAPFAAACGSQFQCPHYTQRLLRCDRQVGGTEYGIAHVGVELAVIAGRGRAILGSKCVAVWRQQRAPALGGS